MDYKKLSDAIRLCGSTHKINECKEKCPYYAGGDMMKCIPVMTKDAADVIVELSEKVEILENRNKHLAMNIRLLLEDKQSSTNDSKHFGDGWWNNYGID